LFLRFSRKSFTRPQKPFRKFPARVQIKKAAQLLKIPLWGGTFKTHFSCRQRAQGRAAFFRRLRFGVTLNVLEVIIHFLGQQTFGAFNTFLLNFFPVPHISRANPDFSCKESALYPRIWNISIYARI